MLACKTQGIGSCPVRGFNQEKLAEKLDLKETERPILIFPIGYPKEEDRNWRRNGAETYDTLLNFLENFLSELVITVYNAFSRPE